MAWHNHSKPRLSIKAQLITSEDKYLTKSVKIDIKLLFAYEEGTVEFN